MVVRLDLDMNLYRVRSIYEFQSHSGLKIFNINHF